MLLSALVLGVRQKTAGRKTGPMATLAAAAKPRHGLNDAF